MDSYKPTVLIATGIMNAGGTETLIMEMLRHQTGCVHYILMIHYQGDIPRGIYDDEIRSLGVKMVYIPSVGSLGIKGYCRKFKEVVDSLGQVEVVHSHLNANGGIICMAAKQAGIKHRISHCHADICFKGSTISKVKNELSLQVLRLYVNYYSNHFWACSHAAFRQHPASAPHRSFSVESGSISDSPQWLWAGAWNRDLLYLRQVEKHLLQRGS